MSVIEHKGQKLRCQVGSEAGHWYLPEPPMLVTEIIGKNGNWRSINVRDARNLDLFPGVTGVIGIESAWGLVRWQRRMVALAAATSPSLHQMMADDVADEEKIISTILSEADAIAKQAAGEGTEIHAYVEKCLPVLKSDPGHPFHRHYEATFDALTDAGLPLMGWSLEECASHHLGYGCRVDLIHRDLRFVGDIKTKEFDADDMERLKPYDNHKEQLWANSHAVGMPDADKFILYISRNNPGLARVCFIDPDDSPWQIFLTKLDLFQKRKGLPQRVATDRAVA